MELVSDQTAKLITAAYHHNFVGSEAGRGRWKQKGMSRQTYTIIQ